MNPKEPRLPSILFWDLPHFSYDNPMANGLAITFNSLLRSSGGLSSRMIMVWWYGLQFSFEIFEGRWTLTVFKNVEIATFNSLLRSSCVVWQSWYPWAKYPSILFWDLPGVSGTPTSISLGRSLQFSFEIFPGYYPPRLWSRWKQGLQFSFEIFIEGFILLGFPQTFFAFNSLLRSSLKPWSIRMRITLSAMPSILFWDLLRRVADWVVLMRVRTFNSLLRSSSFFTTVGKDIENFGPSILFWDLLRHHVCIMSPGSRPSFNSLLRSSQF